MQLPAIFPGPQHRSVPARCRILLALQIERRYTNRRFSRVRKPGLSGHGNYGFAAASQFYFANRHDLKSRKRAARGMVNGPKFSPLSNPEQRSTGASRSPPHDEEGRSLLPKKSPRENRRSLHIQYPRNDLAPYFSRHPQISRSHVRHEAVHERGLRVYTTLNLNMQHSPINLSDGLHAYERRHGWKAICRRGPTILGSSNL